MALHYRIVRRKNPQNTAETQYIMHHVSRGVVDLDQILEEISKESAFSPADVLGVVTALTGRLQQHLGDGNIVDLGGLGRYKVGFKAKPLEGPTPATKQKQKSFTLIFNPAPA